MSIISRNNINALLQPGLDLIIGVETKSYNNQYKKLFETRRSKRAYETQVEMKPTGAATLVSEGEAVTFDNTEQLFTTTFQHVKVGLGTLFTKEAIEDNLYDAEFPRVGKQLANSTTQVIESLGADIYNNADDVNLLRLADGQPFASTAHPTAAGVTYSNTFPINVTLNETSLEDAIIAINNLRDGAGSLEPFKAKKLCVNPRLEYQAVRLLDSTHRVGTNNNDINAINKLSSIPEGTETFNYFTRDNLWVILTDADGRYHFERQPLEMMSDTDPKTGNLTIVTNWRGSFGISNARTAFVAF